MRGLACAWKCRWIGGGVAQLGEHLLCKQGVIGSNPFTSISLAVRGGLVAEKSGIRHMPGRSPIGGVLALVDGVGWCSLGVPGLRLFFRIVNQVLVRLWTRRLVEDPCERVPTARELRRCNAWGSRSLTGQGPAGWQHLVGYSLAIGGKSIRDVLRMCWL